MVELPSTIIKLETLKVIAKRFQIQTPQISELAEGFPAEKFCLFKDKLEPKKVRFTESRTRSPG